MQHITSNVTVHWNTQRVVPVATTGAAMCGLDMCLHCFQVCASNAMYCAYPDGQYRIEV